MVYANQVLMRKDQQICVDLVRAIQQQERVFYHCDLQFEVNKGDVIVFDEGDQHIYLQTEQLDALTKDESVSCICLTATSGECEGDNYEALLLKHLGFKHFFASKPE